MEKLKTKTVGKFQALYCLSKEYSVYNIHAPFLVLAHTEKKIICLFLFVKLIIKSLLVDSSA